MTTQFQKLLSEKYDIQAAGIGVDINGFPLKNAKVISMVLISKDKSEMAIVDLIDSNLMCLISLSKEPRYVNAGESKGGWEEIKAN